MKSNHQKMGIQINVGQCFINRKNLVGKTTPYVSFRSGLHRARTEVLEGSQPNFNQVLQMSSQQHLTVKIKDSGLYTCFGSAGLGGPFNTMLGEVKINLTRCYQSMETIQGYYPLRYKNQDAGKIYLMITPFQR